MTFQFDLLKIVVKFQVTFNCPVVNNGKNQLQNKLSLFLTSRHSTFIFQEIVTVTIPHKVFGDFLILVRTDASNSVYEHLNEDNNIGQSEVCDK